MQDHNGHEVRVSAKTLAKVALFILLSYVVFKLLPLLLSIFLASLLAVSLNPLIRKLVKWGMNRFLAIAVVTTAILLIVAGFIFLVGPELVEQIQAFVTNWPEYKQKLYDSLSNHKSIQNFITQASGHISLDKMPSVLPQALGAGQLVFASIAEFITICVMAFYLLLEGKGTYEWITHYFPRKHKKKMDDAVPELSQVISSYVAGQAITSASAGVFAYIVLKILDVPAPLAFALLAGIFDLLPIIGFFIFAIPPVILALQISPYTALLLFGLYCGYEIFESYVLVPLVYGKKMELSNLAVFIGVIVGGLLAGIPGIIAVLPMIAAYPIFERVWLNEGQVSSKSS